MQAYAYMVAAIVKLCRCQISRVQQLKVPGLPGPNGSQGPNVMLEAMEFDCPRKVRKDLQAIRTWRNFPICKGNAQSSSYSLHLPAIGKMKDQCLLEIPINRNNLVAFGCRAPIAS